STPERPRIASLTSMSSSKAIASGHEPWTSACRGSIFADSWRKSRAGWSETTRHPSSTALSSPHIRRDRVHHHRSCFISSEQQVCCVPAAVVIRVNCLAWPRQSADDVAGLDGLNSETADSLHQWDTVVHGVFPEFLGNDPDEFAGIDPSPLLERHIANGQRIALRITTEVLIENSHHLISGHRTGGVIVAFRGRVDELLNFLDLRDPNGRSVGVEQHILGFVSSLRPCEAKLCLRCALCRVVVLVTVDGDIAQRRCHIGPGHVDGRHDAAVEIGKLLEVRIRAPRLDRGHQVELLIIDTDRIRHPVPTDRKSTRLNSSHVSISYAV